MQCTFPSYIIGKILCSYVCIKVKTTCSSVAFTDVNWKNLNLIFHLEVMVILGE